MATRSHSEFLNRIRQLCAPLEPVATNIPAKLAPVPDIRCVLWDVYGTLLISGSGDIGIATASHRNESLSEAWNNIFPIPAPPSLSIESLVNAIRHEHDVQRHAGVDCPEVDIRDIWASIARLDRKKHTVQIEQLALEYECRVNPVWPMPHARSVLHSLRERGVALGIVSNAQFYTPLCMEALFGRSIQQLGFEPDLCAWSYVQRAGKPSHRMFDTVISSLRARAILPNQTLFVGNDMLNDIAAAHDAGLKTALFAGDGRSYRPRPDHPRCRGLLPDLVLTALDPLPDTLAQ